MESVCLITLVLFQSGSAIQQTVINPAEIIKMEGDSHIPKCQIFMTEGLTVGANEYCSDIADQINQSRRDCN